MKDEVEDTVVGVILAYLVEEGGDGVNEEEEVIEVGVEAEDLAEVVVPFRKTE